MAATKVSFTWFGVRKALSAAQKAQAADSFAADAQFLSAAKKLLDTRHDAYRAATAVRGRLLAYWRGITLPYPVPGLRLIRQDDLAALGRLSIARASQVEPDAQILDGPLLGPFPTRSAALAAEVAWLTTHRLPMAHR